MQVLDRIQNKIGAFPSVGITPPIGNKSVLLTGDMPTNEITDTTNYVRLLVEADFGTGYKLMARGPAWHGGPGQTIPNVTWAFDSNHPPLFVRGVLENGTNGVGTAAVCGLTLAFA